MRLDNEPPLLIVWYEEAESKEADMYYYTMQSWNPKLISYKAETKFCAPSMLEYSAFLSQY